MQKEIEIYMEHDGFYAGRRLKDGSLSKDAHRITGQEILTMFTETMKGHCQKNCTDKLWFQDAEGNLYVAAKARTSAPLRRKQEKKNEK